MLRAILVNNRRKLLTCRSLRFLSSRPGLLVRSFSSPRAAIKAKETSPGMDLHRIVAELHKMFPPCLAEDWDNVGLLVEPSSHVQQLVNHIVLTNDLTEQVMEEVEKAVPKAGLIIAYHPPIFKPITTLTRGTAKERIILKAVESRIAIYSPHTAADSVCGGVNDWLAGGLGDGEIRPLRPVGPLYDVMAFQLISQQCELLNKEVVRCGGKLQKTSRDDSLFDVAIQCKLDVLPQVYAIVCGQLTSWNVPVHVPVSRSKDDQMKCSGVGRRVALSNPISLSNVVERVKRHLQLSSVRLARGKECEDATMVNTIAICAGSGATVLRGVTADVFLTGEMSHHEVLDATSRGTSVILCEHSNTERGYLTIMKQKLQQVLGNEIKISISDVDHDPLVTV